MICRVRFGALSLALILLGLSLASPVRAGADAGAGYQTFVSGDEAAHTPDPIVGGLLLNGGGAWNHEAFRWFTAHAGHGHIVVLRASGTTESQDEFYNVIKGVLSVRTFLFTDRKAASDPRVLEAVKSADGIFIAGGDQSNYVRMWRGTPLNALIDAHVAEGKPLAGTSAGLAIQGAWLYGSMDGGSITGPEAMADPLGKAVTIEGDFLHTPVLAHIFTDSHFDTRARLGRLFAFLAKTHTLDPELALVGLGIDEDSAMTVEADGTARFYADVPGKHAWLVQPGEFGALEAGQPLNLAGVRVTGIDAGSTFNVRTLQVGAPAFVRRYDVVNGVITRQAQWSAGDGPEAPADAVFSHGFVYTVDEVMPSTHALAVRDGRIVYLGDDEGVQAYL